MCVLIVDNFGIEYIHKLDTNHLLPALQQSYTVTTERTGIKFAGINIKWYYTNCTAHTFMDGNITNVRTRFSHPDPKKSEHLPHKHKAITYGAKEQYTDTEINTSPMLDAIGIKKVQGIIGALLYYARAVDKKISSHSIPLASNRQP